DDARAAGQYDLVLANPPYVPSDAPLRGTGPDRAWEAGADGRVVLDQLCALAPDLVAPGGALLIVHPALSVPARTTRMPSAAGLPTRVIGFGPGMTAHADRLEAAGLLEAGRRTEELVVIRADRR